MPLPQPYTPGYNFTAFQQGQGDNTFPGTNLDAELASVAAAINALDAFVAAAYRSDGAPTNGSIGRDALSSDIQIGLAPPVPWQPETAYAAGQALTYATGLYYVPAAYTSSDDFAADAAVGFVALIANFATLGLLAPDSVGADQIVDGAVTADKLADASVGNSALQPGAIDRSKVSADFGILPIGAEMPFAGVTTPSGWLREDGKAYDRVTYQALFQVLTQQVAASVTTGSNALSAATVDLTADGASKFVGSVVEGFGIPAGTQVVSATPTTIMLSANATGTATGAVFRFYPYGNGDGASTFNVPDARDRAIVGRGDIGGTDAALITQLGGLGSAAGEEKHTLTAAEGPIHNHPVNDAGHAHGTSEANHLHGATWPDIAGSMGGGANYGQATGPFANSTNGASTNLSVRSATTGVMIGNNATGGGAHNNLQPSSVRDMIIFAGV